MRLIAYNMGRGWSRNPALWARMLAGLEPDLLFVQESRDPTLSWLAALSEGAGTTSHPWLWTAVPDARWGSGLWARKGRLTPLPVPEAYTGRVVAAIAEGQEWPGVGVAPVVALSIHAPTRKGSSYIKEVGRILDFAGKLADGCQLVLAGDFNVAVGSRDAGQQMSNTHGEQALLQRLREELDLIPCWQTAHPGEPLARTLRWMRKSDSLPYHCDGVFMPRAWASALRSCEVPEGDDWCALSDHNPVVVTLGTA